LLVLEDGPDDQQENHCRGGIDWRAGRALVVGARIPSVARALNPDLQTFDEWLATHKSKIPL
jgi:hypothetical protein